MTPSNAPLAAVPFVSTRAATRKFTAGPPWANDASAVNVATDAPSTASANAAPFLIAATCVQTPIGIAAGDWSEYPPL